MPDHRRVFPADAASGSLWLMGYVNIVALRFDQTQSLLRDNLFIEILSRWASTGVCVCVRKGG